MSALADTLSVLQDLLPSKCRCVTSALAMQPQWFQGMVTGAAIEEFEGNYGFHFSESLRLFYRLPAYAVFLRCHRSTDVFLEDWTEDLPSYPIWTKTSYPPWIAIAQSMDTSQFLMVQLDHPRPQIAWRYFPTSEGGHIFRFDDWLMQGAMDALNTYRVDGDCRLCTKRDDSPGA